MNNVAHFNHAPILKLNSMLPFSMFPFSMIRNEQNLDNSEASEKI